MLFWVLFSVIQFHSSKFYFLSWSSWPVTVPQNEVPECPGTLPPQEPAIIDRDSMRFSAIIAGKISILGLVQLLFIHASAGNHLLLSFSQHIVYYSNYSYPFNSLINFLDGCTYLFACFQLLLFG